MSDTVVSIFRAQMLCHQFDLDGPVQLGRQDVNEPLPFGTVQSNDTRRLIIAPSSDAGIPRRHVRLEPFGNGSVKVTNQGRGMIEAGGHGTIPAESSCDLAMPVQWSIGDLVIRVETVEADGSLLPLQTRMHVPGTAEDNTGPLPPGLTQLAGDEATRVIAWFKTLIGVSHSATGSNEFFQQAAQAVVNSLHLDSGRVLLRIDSEWKETARHVRPGLDSTNWPTSRSVLKHVLENKTTFREVPRPEKSEAFRVVDAVVAAPILDADDNVIGVLYGDRRRGQDETAPVISELEAQLVNLLASSVATGLARSEQQKSALASRTRFEQFFTPRLAQELEQNPDLLTGSQHEISVLFCDIRAFSAAAKNLGPRLTFKWIGDVLQELSECVHRTDGVLVDYIGDALMAMWGAPTPQPDHATRACYAAQEMLKKLTVIDQRWEETLGHPTEIGIGINSGMAEVGNTGSKFKYKYGPLGHTVNLASRVEGATKYFKRPLLITGATQERLTEGFSVRRLRAVEVVGIEGDVEVYEVAAEPNGAETSFWPAYEQALVALEGGHFSEAAQMLGPLLLDALKRGEPDIPARLLLHRAAGYLADVAGPFQKAWKLPGK